MKAFRRFTVRVPLPESLADLSVLAHNLRWSWHTPTQNIFAAVDPDLWSADRDPLRLLSEVSPERIAELSTDTDFIGRLREAAADLESYLADSAWFGDYAATLDGDPTHAAPSGIAYFSMEFGISEVLPIYSGGLGILAGDHLKSASDLGIPLVGVGLLYRNGYFQQRLATDGWQIEDLRSSNGTYVGGTRTRRAMSTSRASIASP